MAARNPDALRITAALLIGVIAVGAFQLAWKLSPSPEPAASPPATASVSPQDGPLLERLPADVSPILVVPDFGSAAARLASAPLVSLFADPRFFDDLLAGLGVLDSEAVRRRLRDLLAKTRSLALAARPDGSLVLLAFLDEGGLERFRDLLASLCNGTAMSPAGGPGTESLNFRGRPVLSYRTDGPVLELFAPGSPPVRGSSEFVPPPPDLTRGYAAWGFVPSPAGRISYLMRPSPRGFCWRVTVPFALERPPAALEGPADPSGFALAAGLKLPEALDVLNALRPGEPLRPPDWLADAGGSALWLLRGRDVPGFVWLLAGPRPEETGGMLANKAREAGLSPREHAPGVFFVEGSGFDLEYVPEKVRFWAVRKDYVAFSSSEFALKRALDLPMRRTEGEIMSLACDVGFFARAYLPMLALSSGGALDSENLERIIGRLGVERVTVRPASSEGVTAAGETFLPAGALLMYLLHAYNNGMAVDE